MSIETYCGWTNKETYTISQRFSGIFDDIAKKHKFSSVTTMSDSFMNIVFQLEVDTLDISSFAREAIESFLSHVNFDEIAGAYFKSV